MQTLPVGYGRLAVEQFLGTQFFQSQVEAQLTHRSHIGAELEGSCLVPARHMGAHGLGREELREAPLDVDALHRIGIVATPEFGEILQRLVVTTCTAARAEHHGHVGIVVLHALHHVIDAADMVDVQLSLFSFEVGRIDVGDRAVAVHLK